MLQIKFVEAIFGEPIDHKSNIFPFNSFMGKKRGINLTFQVQIPHRTEVKFKSSPHSLKGLSSQLPIPWARKMVKRLGYAREEGEGGGEC